MYSRVGFYALCVITVQNKIFLFYSTHFSRFQSKYLQQYHTASTARSYAITQVLSCTAAFSASWEVSGLVGTLALSQRFATFVFQVFQYLKYASVPSINNSMDIYSYLILLPPRAFYLCANIKSILC